MVRRLVAPTGLLMQGLLGVLLILTGVTLASARHLPLIHPAASTSDSAGSGALTTLPGSRLLDTRRGPGAMRSGEVRLLQVAGRGGVPNAGAESVVLTVTATGPSTAGYLSVYPGGARNPGTSTLNFIAGQTVSNTAIVSLSDVGQISLRSMGGSVHVVVDVTGWYSAGDTPVAGGFVPVGATRLIDTRITATPLRGTSPLSIAVSGTDDVPADATAVVVNITGISARTSAAVTAWPAGEARPIASSLNLVPGGVAANLAFIKVGTGGAISLAATGGQVDVVVDLVGYVSGGTTATGGTVPITPYRLLDTRSMGNQRPVGAGQTVIVVPANASDVPPAGATAVVLTVTAASSTVSGGYVTVWAAGTRPVTSSLNPRTDRPVAITVVVGIGFDGGLRVFNALGNTHLIVDITGYVVD